MGFVVQHLKKKSKKTHEYKYKFTKFRNNVMHFSFLCRASYANIKSWIFTIKEGEVSLWNSHWKYFAKRGSEDILSCNACEGFVGMKWHRPPFLSKMCHMGIMKWLTLKPHYVFMFSHMTTFPYSEVFVNLCEIVTCKF